MVGQEDGAHDSGVHQWTLTLLTPAARCNQPSWSAALLAKHFKHHSMPLTLLHQLLHRVQPRQDGGPVPQRLAHPAAQQASTKRRLRAEGWLCKCEATRVQPARSDGLTGKADAGQGCAPQQASHIQCKAVGQQCPTASRRRTSVWSSTHIRLPFSPPLLLFWKTSSCLQSRVGAGWRQSGNIVSYPFRGQQLSRAQRCFAAAVHLPPPSLSALPPTHRRVLALSLISAAVAHSWKEAPRRSTASSPKGFR